MAPKSPWNQKTTLNPKAAPVPAINYSEIQSDEIDVLKAIYMEDFEDVETKTAWNKTTDRSFKLKVRSSLDPDSSIVLSVTFSVTYPRSPPLLEVAGLEGYHERTQKRIRNVVRNRPKGMLGEAMIHAIATELEEALEDAVSARQQGTLPSLEEERASAEEVASGLAKEAEEAEARRRQEAQEEEDRVLKEMVDEELSRRQRRKSAKDPSALTSQPSISEEDIVCFDQPATLQVGNDTLQFNAVAIVSSLPSSKNEQLFLGKVSDTMSSALVAVKKLACNEGRDSIVQIEFMLETVRTLRHPNLLSLLAHRIDRVDNGPTSQFALCSDYADRGTLHELVELAAPLHPDKARRFTVEILEALEYLHHNGVAHGSLSTSSIFLNSTPSLSPKLGQLGQWMLQPQKNALPHKWQAPEGDEISTSLRRKSDIWGLGVVVVEMFIGPQMLNEYQSPLSMLAKLNPSDAFDDFARKMFALDAKKRPSAFDLLPVEFLRTDVPVVDELPPVNIRRRRHTSSAGITSPINRRSRHNSSNLLEPMSRYAADFTEIGRLGKGGFGEVVKARNKLDGGVYAIKKVKQAPQLLDQTLSEVMLLNRLNHPYVVRYFGAWVETDMSNNLSESVTSTTDDTTDESSSDGPRMDFGYQSTGGLDFVSSGYPQIEFGDDNDDDEECDTSSDDETAEELEDTHARNGELAPASSDVSEVGDLGLRHTRSTSHRPPSILFLVMELCERHTLRDLIRRTMSEEDAWRYVRQITEGLSHIHSHGIIHRDLKPENVFIDVAGNPKIGDFGLATTSQYHFVERTTPFSGQSSGDMTRSVGTTLYVAPELSSASGGQYNDRVDMYSLGIMFFEMCEVFGTAMERIRALQGIRGKDRVLPSVYHANGEKAAQGRLIDCLISHKPSERASSAELLRSGMIPVEVLDEAIRQALSGLSDPRSPYHQKIMSALFAHDPGSSVRVKALAWGSEMQSDARRLRLRTIARQAMESTFRKHGAEETRRPTLFPRSTHNTDPSVVQLLDASGNLLQLPYDLILPHARQLALHKPEVKKSFAFGNAYRDTFTGGSPRVNDEVDFDIALTGKDDDPTFDEAEVIKVMDEIVCEISAFATSASISFHLNHTSILYTILEHCRVPIAKQSIVVETISRLGSQRWTWPKVRAELRKIGLSDTTLDDLQQFDFRDAPEKAFKRLRALLSSAAARLKDGLDCGIQSLHEIVVILSQLSLQRKVLIAPLGSVNAKFYEGGMLFQCVLERKSNRTVIAAGGRYDSLVKAHRPTSAPAACNGAVGVSIGLDSILTHMSKTSGTGSKGMFLKDAQQPESRPKRCDVLVEASDTEGARTAAIKLLSTLWTGNISAELATDIRARVDREDYSFVITVRHEASNTVRVSSTSSDAEDTDIPTASLVPHLQQELKENEASKPRQPAFTRHTSHQDADRKSNVHVLMAQHRSKKTNKYHIVEAARQRWAEKLDGWKEVPILAVETSDDVLESIRETRLGDAESWRKAVQSVPVNERQLLQQIQDLLGSWHIDHVYPHDEFDIGRRDLQQAWGLNEISISTHHLRIRCIMYENDGDVHVSPLIYVRVLSRNSVVLSHSDPNIPSAASTLSSDSGDVLLNHGDVLQLTPSISIHFASVDDQQDVSSGLDVTTQAEVKHFAKQYQVTGRVLGAGGHASVFLAVKQSTRRQVACKIVPLPNAHQPKWRPSAAKDRELELRLVKKRESLAREYNVLKDLNHPNIICLEKVFCASYQIYIFQELITGGDLLSYVDKMGVLGEPQTAVIVRQILMAVEYLHSNQIVHRDIKPENVLMISWREGARVVLTDFGQARALQNSKDAAKSSAVFRMQSTVGTYGYTAPEVYQQLKRDLREGEGYSKAVDIWSVGCITATLLTGDMMFSDEHNEIAAEGQTNTESLRKRWDLSVLDTGTLWRSVGRKAKSFVRGCLDVDEAQRLTAKQALTHEWFANKHYAAELEAAYQRAIQDWKPRSKGGNLIEFIDTIDDVPSSARHSDMERLVEQGSTSHRFPAASASNHPPITFSYNNIRLTPLKTRHTPLPTVTEDIDGERTQTQFTNDTISRDAMLASPMVCVPASPVEQQRNTPYSFESLSVGDFVPPDSQFGTLPPRPPAWHDSFTQTQMLDNSMPPKLSFSFGDLYMPASVTGHKRRSSYALIDDFNSGLVDPTLQSMATDVGGQSYGGPGQRKKVYR
ncbi:hypothetical protein LTR08_004421 [Meristemomyces frigidus]|nr:hypothetical protein LTR08_004421 [Meristemomyces frigidus]